MGVQGFESYTPLLILSLLRSFRIDYSRLLIFLSLSSSFFLYFCLFLSLTLSISISSRQLLSPHTFVPLPVSLFLSSHPFFSLTLCLSTSSSVYFNLVLSCQDLSCPFRFFSPFSSPLISFYFLPLSLSTSSFVRSYLSPSVYLFMSANPSLNIHSFMSLSYKQKRLKKRPQTLLKSFLFSLFVSPTFVFFYLSHSIYPCLSVHH